MVGVISKPDTQQKLGILSDDAKYDLACACGTRDEEHRRRGGNGRWIYPVALPNGGTSVLLKTLISNVCSNDCKYCPLRQEQDIRRCTLDPAETARVFLDYFNRRDVFGLFLSSGVIGTPDATMDRLNATARLLRSRHRFKGYIHLKIIPGASDAAIDEAVSLASAVSLNIETPGAAHLAKLSTRKDYLRDIIEPIKRISRLTAKGSRFERVKQTTQFIVGPAGESDAEIVKYMWGLYDRLRMQRIYFSAYQKGLGVASLSDSGGEGILPAIRGRDALDTKERGQDALATSGDPLMREHRLYQVDFLMRKYGFTDVDIPCDDRGYLSLEIDPKEAWAARHPEFFPVQVNRASRLELLRVPGLGPTTVNRILELRRTQRVQSLDQIGRVGARLEKARQYVAF
ncbi:MAG TPA: radical SAM protein [Sedimentisphaerales bacterium]|jgi:predicted DNA-binding helix-hairpin-helix protein|nr:radical SAM protein [Sedimentisphaerales bacterium]HNU27805.1 radical SAM protein [Sedimentisphaerales bacterium]